jgi:hypothetical protein
MGLNAATDSAGVAEWIGAVGTALAVILALWLQWLRVWLRRPALVLDFDVERDRADIRHADGYASHWVRPRVRNRPRRNSADDVELMLARVRLVDPAAESRSERPEELLEGLPLKWSEVESTKVSIPPGTARRIDFVHVDNTRAERNAEGVEERLERAPIRFDVHPLPAAKYHRAFGHAYEVTLALTARDTDAVFYVTRVSYDGVLRDEPRAMAEALSVESLRRLRKPSG